MTAVPLALDPRFRGGNEELFQPGIRTDNDLIPWMKLE
jgi:hypothetical protein